MLATGVPSSAGSWLPLGLAALVLLSGSGCPERSSSSERAPTQAQQPCTQFGQRCEFSPGKLGTCVERDDCSGNDCFICQSQH
jgi:hypothetical protein